MHLFHKINALYSNEGKDDALSPEIISLFNQHPWPGNVRQLVSVIQIAQAMSDDEQIQKVHLPDDFFEDLNASKTSINQEDSLNSVQGEHLVEHMVSHLNAEDKAAADKVELLQTYNLYKGNISKTAKALSISRNTLYKRLKEINIR